MGSSPPSQQSNIGIRSINSSSTASSTVTSPAGKKQPLVKEHSTYLVNTSYQLPLLPSSTSSSYPLQTSGVTTYKSPLATPPLPPLPQPTSTQFSAGHNTPSTENTPSSSQKPLVNNNNNNNNNSGYPEENSRSQLMSPYVPTRQTTLYAEPVKTPAVTATVATTTTETDTATTGYRPLNVKDALSYLDQVKIRFGDRPDVYNRFLDIMKDFKSQNIDTPGVIERVSTLFQGNPSLISGFNTFLPPGYHIECSTDPLDPDMIRVTTPSGTITSSSSKRSYHHHSSPSAMDKSSIAPTPLQRGPYFTQAPNQSSSPMVPQDHQHQQAQFENQHQQMHYSHPHPMFRYPPQAPTSHPQYHPMPPMTQQQHQYQHPLYQQPPPPLQNLTTTTSQSSVPTSHKSQSHQQAPSNSPATHAQQTSQMDNTQTNGQPGSNDIKRPTLDFNNAINYVNKIKNRFVDNPDAYKQFLEVLQTYQKEEQKIEDVYAHVKRLFYGHADLLDEFQQFLPEVSQLNGNKRSLVDSGPSSFVPAGKKKRGLNRKLKQGSDGDYYDNGDWYGRHDGYTGRQGFDPNNPTVSNDEVELFEQIRKHIGNKPSYEVFLKLLNLYSQDIIDLDILMERVHAFLGSKPKLLDWFKSVIGYGSSSNLTPRHLGSLDEKTVLSNMIPKPDLVHCNTVPESPSYRVVPKDWQHQPCSGRDSLCWEVLNDAYASHPIWASEESGFTASKKNPYEEAMHRCEEERYDYDLNIDANLSSIALLEPIVKNLETMTPDEQEVFTLSPGLGGQSTSIYERIIKKIYGAERGTEVIQLLYSNPSRVAPLVVKRLKQKCEEWTKGQNEWNKVWREIDEKNYYKSFDYQGLTFKSTERKTLTTRYLLNEIEKIYQHDEDDDELDKRRHGLEQKKTPPLNKENTTGNLGLTYAFDDAGLFKDISLLIFSYMEHQNGFSKADRDKVHQFIATLIPSFFLVDDVIPAEYYGATTGGRYSHFISNNNNNNRNNSNDDNSSNDSSNDKGTRNGNGSNENPNGNENEEEEEEEEDTNSLSSHSEGYIDSSQKNGHEKTKGKQQTPQRLQRSSRPSSRTRSATSTQSQALADDVEESNPQQAQSGTSNDVIGQDGSSQHDDPLASSSATASSSSVSDTTPKPTDRYPPTQQQQQYFMIAATMTAPKFYKRDSNCFFGNTNLYCFFRIFEILYSRLYKMKQLDEEMQRDKKRGNFNSVAEKLGLRSTRFDGIDVSQGHYKALLEQTDRLFSGDVDTTVYEENVRYLFTTESYILFTVDKLVHSIVKQIQTLASDEKSMELIQLYQDNRDIPSAATFRPLSVYRDQAEQIIGQNDYLFKLNFNIKNKHLSIHLLGQEKELGNDDSHETYLASFMDWAKSTQGITVTPMSKSSLKRNIQSGIRQLDNVILDGTLQYCINYDTYRLFFEPGTEDLLYHPPPAFISAALSNTKHTPLANGYQTTTHDTENQANELLIGKDGQDI